MFRWIVIFISIWIIVASFLFNYGVASMINNFTMAAILIFLSFKLNTVEKWGTLLIGIFLAVVPFLPSLPRVISQVNDTSKSLNLNSPVYTKNLIAGIVLILVMFFPKKEKSY
jgi:hypothetical protein